MNETMQRFLNELDAALVPFAKGQRLDLYHLGRSALVSRFQATFSTKDFDIVVRDPTPLEQKAKEMFGEGTSKALELGLYLDFVNEGLPPLPSDFRRRSTEVAGNWQVIRLWDLEPHDLAATKLKRFAPKDREDLRFLCDQGKLNSENLRVSLEKAWRWSTEKDGDRDRDAAFANLKKVIDYLEGNATSI